LFITDKHSFDCPIIKFLQVSQKMARHSFSFQHATSHANDGLIPLLDHTILLWRVRRGQVPLHAVFGEVATEAAGG
jgi:hypothetical protein